MRALPLPDQLLLEIASGKRDSHEIGFSGCVPNAILRRIKPWWDFLLFKSRRTCKLCGEKVSTQDSLRIEQWSDSINKKCSVHIKCIVGNIPSVLVDAKLRCPNPWDAFTSEDKKNNVSLYIAYAYCVLSDWIVEQNRLNQQKIDEGWVDW